MKDSRKNLDFSPPMKLLKQQMQLATGRSNPLFDEFWFKDNVLVYQIVDFAIDGLYNKLESMHEYKTCVNLMNLDSVFKNHVDSHITIFTYLTFLNHWTYISHFLKSMIFQYLQNHDIDMNLFNNLFSNLESFLYADTLEIAIICPLHFFQLDV